MLSLTRAAGRLERTGTILYNRECMIPGEMSQACTAVSFRDTEYRLCQT